MAKIPHCPSYTKPIGKPGDERQLPKRDKADYSKFVKKEEPFQGPDGYRFAGKKSATGGDGKERVRGKPDLTKFTKEEPYTGADGYKSVGSTSKTKGTGEERKYKNKNSSPFRNA